ncbi:hypothetical protein [Vitreoscilla massiliensis]|nr:hypothetical protein [Vitreoscilla massiliensis]
MEDETTIAVIFGCTKYRFIVYLCAKIIKIGSVGGEMVSDDLC